MNTMAIPSQNKDSRNHFTQLSPGKLMGLRRITDEKNRFKVLALDQSNSFRKALKALHAKEGMPQDPDYSEIRDIKLKMVEILSPWATAVLLDVNYAARQALNSMSLPKQVGLIVRLEASKDPGTKSEYEPGWSVEKIKKMGGDAVKLLVYIDTEDAENVKAQINFVKEVSLACEKNDILLMTEELSFPRKGEEKTSPSYKGRKVKNILEAARLIGPYTDILKLEFPGFIQENSASEMEDNLHRLNEAAIRPWVLLSAGEKFEFFAKQAEMAMQAGSSGYMAGRAIFNESFDSSKNQDSFLRSTGIERMKKLNSLVDKIARSWMERYKITAQDLAATLDPQWYLDSKSKNSKTSAAMGSGDY